MWDQVFSFITLVDANYLYDMTLKATVIFLLGGLLSIYFRRASAATRHWIWLLSFYLLLVTAIASYFIPGKSLELIPAIQSQGLLIETPPADMSETPELAGTANPQPQPLSISGESGSIYRISFVDLALIIWIFGATLLLLKLILDQMIISVISRLADKPQHDFQTLDITNLACTSGLRRPPHLKISKIVTVPFTFGWLKPQIILPVGAHRWPLDQLRMVVLHEMAHIARRDYFNTMMVRLLQVLFWYHPLFWLAKYRLGVECEKACDDRVILAGHPQTRYAECLLNFMKTLNSEHPYLGRIMLGMATNQSDFKRRMSAILDRSRPRRTIAPATILSLGVLCSLLILPLGFLSLNAPPPEAITAESPAKLAVVPISGIYPGPQSGAIQLPASLHHHSAEVRILAAQMIADSHDKTHLDALIRALPDNDSAVRAAIIDAIASFNQRRNFYHIIAYINDPAPAVRAATIRALSGIGCEPAFIAIAHLLKDADAGVRAQAVFALQGFDKALLDRCLEDLLLSQPGSNRTLLKKHLRSISQQSALHLLKKLREDSNARVRLAATTTIEMMHGSS